VTGTASGAAAAAALVDQWGSDRDAFYVVAWSLDAGYSAGQIIDAAPQGLILADGTITDPQGAQVEPLHEPEGLLVAVEGEALGLGVVVAAAVPAGGMAGRARVEDEPQDAQVPGLGLLREAFDGGLEEFEKKQARLQTQAETDAAALEAWEALALEQTERITGLTVVLAARGYSGRQILEAYLLDQWEFNYTRDPGTITTVCWYVISSSGERVVPAHAPEDPVHERKCAHLLEQTQAESQPGYADAETQDEDNAEAAVAEAFPRVYRGDGVYRITFYDSDTDATKICENDVTIELRLEADGSAVFTYSPGWGTHIDKDLFECREAAGNTWTGTYDTAAGTFTILPPAEDPQREYWEVGGDFDKDSAFGPAGYARKHPYPDDSGYQRNTYDLEFNLPRVP
jgi:hypothetical protein